MRKENSMEQIQQIRCGNVNCFLLTEGDTGILVDTGRTAHRGTILAACKPYRISLIVLTHGHVDHAQNAAFLSQVLHCPVAMAEEDVDLLPENLAQPLRSHGLFGKLLLSVSLRSMERDLIEPFTPAVFLKDGDSLQDYGLHATILSLPGHTKGSIGVDAGEAGVIVGDALMNFLSPTVSLLYHDEQSLLRSAQRLSALGARRVYFGHGKPATNRPWV